MMADDGIVVPEWDRPENTSAEVMHLLVLIFDYLEDITQGKLSKTEEDLISGFLKHSGISKDTWKQYEQDEGIPIEALKAAHGLNKPQLRRFLKGEPIKRMTPKQELFCIEYHFSGNGKQAAIRAGYSPKAAAYMASRMVNGLPT